MVVSSRDARTNRDAALKAGAIAYYQEPVDSDALLKDIGEALGLSPAAPPPSTRPVAPPDRQS